ncbi:hypothetical protein MKW92_014785, partial [Papaver armeniacum]
CMLEDHTSNGDDALCGCVPGDALAWKWIFALKEEHLLAEWTPKEATHLSR